MDKVKKGDFVEIEYTGQITGGDIFDTTDAEVAKKNGFYNEETKDSYGSVIVKQGLKNVVKGLDEALIDKELNKEYEISLSVEDSFGKKDAKLIKTFALASFKDQRIPPQPGMPVNIDGLPGTILRVGGGRVMVDFNYHLAGRPLTYKFKVKRIVTDQGEKIMSVMKLSGLPVELKVEENKMILETRKEYVEYVNNMLKIAELTAEVREKA